MIRSFLLDSHVALQVANINSTGSVPRRLEGSKRPTNPDVRISSFHRANEMSNAMSRALSRADWIRTSWGCIEKSLANAVGAIARFESSSLRHQHLR